MIADMEQPAKKWLSDLIKNMGVLLDKGEDPSMEIKIGEIVFDFRLMSLPDRFERVDISFEKHSCRCANPEFIERDGDDPYCVKCGRKRDL